MMIKTLIFINIIWTNSIVNQYDTISIIFKKMLSFDCFCRDSFLKKTNIYSVF